MTFVRFYYSGLSMHDIKQQHPIDQLVIFYKKPEVSNQTRPSCRFASIPMVNFPPLSIPHFILYWLIKYTEHHASASYLCIFVYFRKKFKS